LAYVLILKKIQKIAKIAKFQMNLEHPILNIFGHLKGYTLQILKKKFFFKRSQKIFLKKNKSNFLVAAKNLIFLFFSKIFFASA
jgi:hypothetical protein